MVVRGLTIIAGAALGLLAGYVGGVADTVVMRTVDILYAFPVILLAMAITVVLGPGFNTLVLALVLVSWPVVARLLRGQALTLKDAEYVTAARAMGVGSGRILLRHILPNCLDLIVVAFSIGIPGAIMYEAELSFFGFGIQPPTPSLGSIIADGRGYIFCVLEAGITWMPFIMYRLDTAYRRHRTEVPELAKRLSDYIRAWGIGTHELEELPRPGDLARVAALYGGESTTMWASDWPHQERDLLGGIMRYDLSDQLRRKILGENAIEFWGFSRCGDAWGVAESF